MPMYKWKDKNTGIEVEVIRSFKEYEVPPNLEEKPVAMELPQFEEAVWERVIGGGVKVVKGDNWGGKGYW